MRPLLALLCLCWCSASLALDFPLPPTMEPGDIAMLTSDSTDAAPEQKWMCLPDPTRLIDLKDGRAVFAAGLKPNTHTIILIDWKSKQAIQKSITIGTPAPIPPGPGPIPTPGPTPGPLPSPLIPNPSPELQSVVAPVKAALSQATPEHKRLLTAFYSDLALMVKNSMKVSSTSLLRGLHVEAGKMMNEKYAIKGVYPALPAAVNNALATAIGLDDKALDTALRAKAVDALYAIAWACQ